MFVHSLTFSNACFHEFFNVLVFSFSPFLPFILHNLIGEAGERTRAFSLFSVHFEQETERGDFLYTLSSLLSPCLYEQFTTRTTQMVRCLRFCSPFILRTAAVFICVSFSLYLCFIRCWTTAVTISLSRRPTFVSQSVYRRVKLRNILSSHHPSPHHLLLSQTVTAIKSVVSANICEASLTSSFRTSFFAIFKSFPLNFNYPIDRFNAHNIFIEVSKVQDSTPWTLRVDHTAAHSREPISLYFLIRR